jgi:hypothetical protein
VIVLGAVIALVVVDIRLVDVGQQAASEPPSGVEEVDVGPGVKHTEGNVDYQQTPPAGGKHNPVWQNAGFYEEPVRNENAVHTLEHGAVWITYSPSLPQEDKDRIREVVSGQDCVLASPYPGLPTPVVASAWGKQLRLDSADDPRLEQFVSAYQQGPQSPEVAPCIGGVGSPE